MKKMYDCKYCSRSTFIDYKYTNDKDKCIFHIEKDLWIKIINSEDDEFNLGSGQQIFWDDEKVKYFWEKFKNIVNEKGLTEKEYYYRFNNYIFPNMEMETFENFQFSSDLVFNETCIFKGNIYFYKSIFDKQIYFNDCKKVANVYFIKSIFNDRFTFNNLKELKKVNFRFSEFNKKFEFKYSKSEEIDLTNVVFKELADFNRTEFEVTNFFKTNFENITVFTQATFKNYVNFKYTTFSKLAIFRDATFENKLNLEDAIFKEEVNFLKINADVKNRETARIIKDSFEQQNNIIEANKFYALEMKERENELSWKKDFFEKLVFSFHGISSNHSQDWLLALFWILNITFSFFITAKSINLFNISLNSFIPLISIVIIGTIISNIKYSKNLFLILLTFLNYGLFKIISDKHNLDCVAEKINPFSIMTEFSQLDFVTLIYKIIIGYLIYQLIISIRQNTRRK